MRNFLYVVIGLFILFGCGYSPPIKKFPQAKITYNINFKKYSEKGFLFTPYSYNKDYESIGIVRFVITAEAFYDDRASAPIKHWIYRKISINDAVEFAYREAIEMGANAVTDFEITTSIQKVYPGKIFEANIPQIEIFGLAIRRK